MKNVSLIDDDVDGKDTFGLLGPDGLRIAAFDAFASTLAKGPYNTRATYCRSLAAFFDYLIEASNHLQAKGSHLDRDLLLAVLTSYREYLVFGANSGNDIARSVNATMPSPLVGQASCETMHASVKRFLDLSETLRRHFEELRRHGLSSSAVDPLPLLPATRKKAPTRHQTQALLASSILAGVIAGGPQLLTEAALPAVTGTTPYDEKRAFPFDAAAPLIEAMPSWRDKSLYAFCAASGCRVSEALQLLWDDIRLSDGTVKLIDPGRRPNDASYLALEPRERDRLVWKGRVTQATLLIEPFSSMFFEALEQYVRVEYIPHGLHQFVFQHLRKGYEGRPYFLSAASSRNEIFARAVNMCLAPEMRSDDLGVHSLRHMYGTYLLNYFPRADGSHGLPLGLVKQLMGHKKVTSTAVYARHDADLLQAELAFASAMVFGSGAAKSLNELKRDALLAKLGAVEREIQQEDAIKAIARKKLQ